MLASFPFCDPVSQMNSRRPTWKRWCMSHSRCSSKCIAAMVSQAEDQSQSANVLLPPGASLILVSKDFAGKTTIEIPWNPKVGECRHEGSMILRKNLALAEFRLACPRSLSDLCLTVRQVRLGGRLFLHVSGSRQDCTWQEGQGHWKLWRGQGGPQETRPIEILLYIDFTITM